MYEHVCLHVIYYTCSFQVCILVVCTVEPPSKGHFGEMAFVPCREVGPISEVGLFFIVSGLDAFLLSL